MSLLNKIVFVVLGFFLVLAVAIINNYPLISQDTAAYLNTAYAWFFPSDRPAFYGIFIKVVSLTHSIWWPIIGQGLLLSFLLVQMLLKVLPKLSLQLGLAAMLFIVIITPVSWVVSQVTADIFTAILLLAVIMFLLEAKRKQQLIYVLIAFAAMLMHNANTLSMLCLGALMLFISYYKFRVKFKKMGLLFLVAIVSFFTQCTSNYIVNDSFTFSKVGHVFFMGKMVESGLLKMFLEENCSSSSYSLCSYKDSLPPFACDFVWQEGKVFHKTGGWHASKEEYDKIIMKTFLTPKYLKFHIKESVAATVKQVSLTFMDDLFRPFTKGTNPYFYIEKWLPQSVPFLLRAKQQQGQIKYSFISWIYRPVLLISVFLALLLLFSKLKIEYKFVLLVVVLFIVSNAFVTATFANVLGRLNARVVWVLPWMVVLFILRTISLKMGETISN